MTKAQTVYATTLNLLGSDLYIKDIQDMIDREHGAADPEFEKTLKQREAERLAAI